MSAPAIPQHLAALANANSLRSARSVILQRLRKGEAVIADVDLNAPELASMRLIVFLAALRYRAPGSSPAEWKAPAKRTPARIVGRLGCNGNRRLCDLTERQKRALVAAVEAESSFQRKGRP